MSVGFRKSLFGFNSDDVMAYIEKTHKQFSEKESVLNEKIESLDNTVADLNAQLTDIISAKAEVEAKLKEYTDKYDEIERLSQNIGKLYLVAQANSKAIMQNSADSSELSRKEVEKNISSIDEAHESLATLKNEIMQTSVDFVTKVENLTASLNSARAQLTENENENNSLAQEFESIYAEISK